MQAIRTKYINPTNTKGARMRATCAAGSIIIALDHALDVEQNHAAAARALQIKLTRQHHGDHWLAQMVCGCLPDGSYAHVFKG
jgi:hypothetical protein